MGKEKRKALRFRVQGGAFAAFGDSMTKVGVLRDISSDGFSFEYLCDETSCRDAEHMDIWMAGSQVHLRDVTCKKVYDISPSSERENNRIGTAIMNRCGLQFGPLSSEHSAMLSSFISACA
jgi:hypothetical protein